MDDCFLTELIRERRLICPVCRQDRLSLTEKHLLCEDCESFWSIRNRVPDLYHGYGSGNDSRTTGQWVDNSDDETVRLVMEALDLNREIHHEAVHEIVSRSRLLSSKDGAVTAEIRDLIGRFQPAADSCAGDVPMDANRSPEITLERHYFPELVASGETLTANIRVKNSGHHPWSSRTDLPVSLAVALALKRKKGARILSGLVRFPVDIPAGRSITLPVPVCFPAFKGGCDLNVYLVFGSNRIAAMAGERIHVTVTPGSFIEKIIRFFGGARNKVVPVIHKNAAPYDQDHQAGRILFEAELKKRKRPTRVLEIGSGIHPQTAWIPDSKTVALDISSPMLELGSLYFTERNLDSKVGFICADGCTPPFKPDTFDAVAMFSALHHFPEPEKVLENTAALLKKDGFLAIMCEPVNDTLEGVETVRELQKGINEQVFTWPEYVRIFEWAGLRPTYLQIDGGSLKAILIRR